jgi:hypothetical protein
MMFDDLRIVNVSSDEMDIYTFQQKKKEKKIMLGLARLSDKLTELGINPQSILNDILAVTTYANKFLPPKINNFFLFRSSLN